MGIGFISESRINFNEQSPYTITKKEVSDLKLFWKRYIRILNGSNKAFKTALRRYYQCSQKSDPEDKIIDLMIAFEAMFLADNAELSFRLALRVSKFLDDEFQNRPLFDFMRSAYNIRSKVVHGSTLSSKDLNIGGNPLRINQIIAELSNILRLALRKYVFECSHFEISDFINLIDEEIIEGKSIQ